MATMYKINIDCVDNTTYYAMAAMSSDKKYLLEFLQKYDHEGSSLLLQIYNSIENDGQLEREISNPKEIYKELEEYDLLDK